MRQRLLSTASAGLLALSAVPALAQQAPTRGATPDVAYPPLQALGRVRCGTPSFQGSTMQFFQPPSDCSATTTNPTAAYDPGDELEIPVVVHVLRDGGGGGNVTDARIDSQITILNEDFRALPGTNGANGIDSGIRFALADTDPQGNATSGIVRYNNSTWHNDGGNYFNSIAWDPDNYLNIYLNEASGALGYVPYLPQTGPAGSNSDRVVVYWAAFGNNAPIGFPFNKGRTATHEIGHYLGLYHTFDGGCGGGSCYASGDRICDTNPESSPNYGCTGNGSTCGNADPIRNYMNYSDDLCMWEFTVEQVRRMRCTLQFYRPSLAEPVAPPNLGTVYCEALTNSVGQAASLVASGSVTVSDNALTFTCSGLPTSQFGYLLMSTSQDSIPFFGGSYGILCLGSPQIRFSNDVLNSGAAGEMVFSPDLTNLPQGTVVGPGTTMNFQMWYRDFLGFNTSNTSDGVEILFD